MLRTYEYKGKKWRYEEGDQPEGAVEIATLKPGTPEKRAAAAKTARRTRKPAEKKAE